MSVEDIFGLMNEDEKPKQKLAASTVAAQPVCLPPQPQVNVQPQTLSSSPAVSNDLRLSREVLLWRLQETLAASEDKKLTELLTDISVYIQSVFIPIQSFKPPNNGSGGQVKKFFSRQSH
jgi:hypothetical protein